MGNEIKVFWKRTAQLSFRSFMQIIKQEAHEDYTGSPQYYGGMGRALQTITSSRGNTTAVLKLDSLSAKVNVLSLPWMLLAGW